MNTFLAQTLCESTITEDRSRFEMTFVDATGQRHKISIPFTIAADLIPVLESGPPIRDRMVETLPGFPARLQSGTPSLSVWCSFASTKSHRMRSAWKMPKRSDASCKSRANTFH